MKKIKKININIYVLIGALVLTVVSVGTTLFYSTSTLSSVDTNKDTVTISKKGATWDDVQQISDLQK